MNKHGSATTTEQDYLDDSRREASNSATAPQRFLVAPGSERREYRLVIHAQPPADVLGGGMVVVLDVSGRDAGSSTVRQHFILPPEPEIDRSHGAFGIATRGERKAAVMALLDRWLADESDYDETTWPVLKEELEKSRLSVRKRFRE